MRYSPICEIGVIGCNLWFHLFIVENRNSWTINLTHFMDFPVFGCYYSADPCDEFVPVTDGPYIVFVEVEGTWENAKYFNVTGSSGYLRGDVNGDGLINIVDAYLVAWYVLYGEIWVGGVFIEENADTNGDGTITIIDALLIAQYSTGLITGFC
ncbi:MAG: dockerin type I repeat-containing protein [Spirochaetales bacterium]|nr:dockerin type I repeat-containing protein [Spirochaetales bacterium]